MRIGARTLRMAQLWWIPLLLLLVACGEDEETASRFPTTEDVGMQQEDMGTTEPDTGEPDMFVLPDVAAPSNPTTVDTRLTSDTVSAGSIVGYDCIVFDQTGLEMETPPDTSVVFAPDDTFMLDGDDWLAIRAGQGTVQCTVPEFGMIDETPAVLTVVPGPAYTVVTQVDDTIIAAGETVSATCEVFDAYGNPIAEAMPELVVNPSGAGIQIQDMSATITLAGLYDIQCRVDGAVEEQSRRIEVQPGLPASIVINTVPNESVYAIGQVITIAWVVTDSYGNRVPDANVRVTSNPAGESFGTGRLRFSSEGTFTITATVDGPTEGGVPLSQSVDVVVNSNGPAIDCASPFDGEMLNRAPGSTLTFSGSVGDANGVSTVSVNGSGVTVAANGSFQSSITARYGINFVEVVATDSFGIENSRTCAFLATNNWKPEASVVDDTVTLKLEQEAIDDNNTTGSPDSLNDLLDAVVNSAGLVSQLDASLLAANPLKANSCDQRVLGICVFRSEVIYEDLRVQGPNETSLTLVPGGLRANAKIRDIEVDVDINGTVNSDGTVEVNDGEIDITFDLELVNGRPSATVRSINLVRIGSINLNFSGFSGFIIDILEPLFEGTVRNLLQNALRDFIRDEFGALVDGVLAGLDISSLGSTFSVPRLDSGTANMNFNLGFSTLSVLTPRALFGIGTRIRAQQVLRGTPSLGVPFPTGSTLANPSLTGSTGVAVHAGMLNQALHALWRAGYFDAVIDASTLGGSFPAGAEIALSTNLPPVIEILSNGDVKLMLGAATATLIYPGIFDVGLNLTLGVTATTRPQIVGDDLQFGPVTIDELVFSTSDVSLDSTNRSLVEGFLTSLMQSVVNSSLNGALPALPIPGFEIPASLGTYGLPEGQEMSIVNPTLRTTTRHFILDGNFGIR